MITNLDIYIGNKLREMRLAANMSQQQVGDLIGVSLQQIRKYEICTSRITASRLYEFTKIFDKSIDDFLKDYVIRPDLYDLGFEDKSNAKIIQSAETKELGYIFNQITDAKIRKSIIQLLKSIAHSNKL